MTPEAKDMPDTTDRRRVVAGLTTAAIMALLRDAHAARSRRLTVTDGATERPCQVRISPERTCATP